jgi:hypothetical protein
VSRRLGTAFSQIAAANASRKRGTFPVLIAESRFVGHLWKAQALGIGSGIIARLTASTLQ